MPISVYILDDEVHAVNLLQYLLAQIPEVQVMGSSERPQIALDEIKQLKPDLAFLDIEMPGMMGIELGSLLRQALPTLEIVYTTAHQQYAVEAFEQDAMDYILKPIDQNRLVNTIQRIEKRRQRQNQKSVRSMNMHVQMLGAFDIYSEQNQRLKWRTAKEKELFAYLLVKGKNGVHRDELLEVLWPEEDYQRAKGYLHTCVSYIRKDLRALGYSKMLTYASEKYYLDQTAMTIDYAKCLEWVENWRNGKGQSYRQMEDSVMKYEGELLEDCDYVWIEQERQQLRRTRIEIGLQLVKRDLGNEDRDQALRKLQKIIQMDPYSEEAYRQLMLIYQQQGKHDEALRVYQQLIEALNELDIEPSPITTQFFAMMTKP
ncbi:response regulator [Marinicrinis sediminis]|uniref:Response regulator n=1 Tax=Marinicrinis sediminis TaxID=1652465 RepID=A0ABW5REL0_9BACL